MTQKLKTDNFSVEKMFGDFYNVPDFQREYVWKEVHVKKMLDDISYLLDEESGIQNDDSEYFMGSIVVYPDEFEVLQIIDGQQRLTTIYLILCAICTYSLKLNVSARAMENLIKSTKMDKKSGNDISEHRLVLQIGDACARLKEIADKAGTNDDISPRQRKGASDSYQNISRAYEIINNYISERVAYSAENITKFRVNFINKIKLVRIETASLADALKIFETINERGVGLTPLDLLKNLLFINLSSSSDSKQWSKLKQEWNKLIKELEDAKEEPMSFLRHYILASYDVDLSNNFPEGKVYDWFRDEKNKNITDGSLEFIRMLQRKAHAYSMFSQGKNADGTDNFSLSNLKRLTGKIRQHNILLLAGERLAKPMFFKLCFHVESLIFVTAFTKEFRKDINITREFSRWAQQLRKVQNEDDFNVFLNETILRKIDDLSADFDATFRILTETKISKQRIKYMLAKLSQFAEEVTYDTKVQLDFYLDNFTIEHIYPKSSDGSLDTVGKLGNLTLLEKSINSSISDSTFEEKKKNYSSSRILLTKSLVDLPTVGTNTQINRAIKLLKLKSFNVWDENSIEERQEMLLAISRQVWGLDRGK